MPKLDNPKWEKFCQMYILLNFNQSQAYAHVYPRIKQPGVGGHRLMNIPEIIDRISELKKEYFDKFKVYEDELLGYLGQIVRADIRDFIEFSEEEREVEVLDDGTKVVRLTPVARIKMDFDGRLVKGLKIRKDGSFEIVLHDKLTALDKLAQHLKLYKSDEDDVVRAMASMYQESKDAREKLAEMEREEEGDG